MKKSIFVLSCFLPLISQAAFSPSANQLFRLENELSRSKPKQLVCRAEGGPRNGNTRGCLSCAPGFHAPSCCVCKYE